MQVLIGIPTHKRPELLRQCLKSIEVQEGELPQTQVFVADNDPKGSAGTQLAAEIAKNYRFPLTSKVIDKPGISAVRNAILDEAKRTGVDFVAWIDDDETASPEWLTSLLKVQEVTRSDVVGGPVEYIFPFPPPPSIVNSRMYWRLPRQSGNCPPLKASGNFLVSTRALTKAGWPSFDSDFGLSGGEDSEWFARLSRLDLTFAWANNAITQETVLPERMTSQWIRRRAYRIGNSTTRAWIKNRNWRIAGVALAKAGIVLALAPLTAPILVSAGWRLWLQVKWWRAAGRFAALFGSYYEEYWERHDGHAEAH